MVVIHGTKKLRDRVDGPSDVAADMPRSVLGDWYATVLFWRPQVALLVNEATLLPLLVRFAPAATLLGRFPDALASLLEAHRVPASLIEQEVAAARTCVLARTRDRSVVGVMTEFGYLAEVRRDEAADLVGLSVQLARTPTSPLYKSYISPDRALAALVQAHQRRTDR